MENMHVNPVGNIEKYIYIIKNDINSKVYIGQSIDPAKRFESHCKGSDKNSLLAKDIKKYGKSHFWYEIIEDKTNNFNDREKYWISYFNSVVPNGYNIMDGGNLPPIYKGEEHPSTKISDDDIERIKMDLKNTQLSYSSIAAKYHTSKRHILRINHGISRTKIDEKYPIRLNKNTSSKLTNDDITVIIDLLKYSYQYIGQIARQFNVEVHLIDKINNGKSYRIDGETYPIRKWKSCGKNFFTYEQVTEIIDLLKNTDISFREIARKYHVNHSQISIICYGTSKKYRRETEKYPIRKIS